MHTPTDLVSVRSNAITSLTPKTDDGRKVIQYGWISTLFHRNWAITQRSVRWRW